MAQLPAPIPDEILTSLDSLVDEALDAFTRDVRYGVAIVADGRKIVQRKTPVKASAHAA